MQILDIKNLFLELKNIDQNEIENLNLDEKKLLILEKKNRGFKENDIVFVSAGDFSKFYWCKMQTYFSIKKNETEKYLGFLRDKIEYSIKLKKIKNIPKNTSEFLNIGNDLTLKDIYELLKLEEYQNIAIKEKVIKAKLELKTFQIPTKRGIFLETIYAKKFPKIHWVKNYKDFIFTCSPDGITKNSVYEFKTSRNNYFAKSNIKKAKLQADIYGLCFDKKIKLIENLTLTSNKITRIEEEIKIDNIDFVIKELRKIINGKLPERPKEKFKCRNCEFKLICKIKY